MMRRGCRTGSFTAIGDCSVTSVSRRSLTCSGETSRSGNSSPGVGGVAQAIVAANREIEGTPEPDLKCWRTGASTFSTDPELPASRPHRR